MLASSGSNISRRALFRSTLLSYHRANDVPKRLVQQLRQSASASTSRHGSPSIWTRIWSEVMKRPIEYATIPTVAAFVGISTNWMGVKMLFYPVEYIGYEWYRTENSPLGIFGWQGVVPTKTEPMAKRLVDVITKRLLSLDEAFGRLDPKEVARLLSPVVEDTIRHDCGQYWAVILHPVLPFILTRVVTALQDEITTVLDIEHLVLEAFIRDKAVLNDLFQKVGRVELKFLVESGFGFGAILGLFQMALWAVAPKPWTLPVAGALVGYITNWIAIKLLFEPADPVPVGPFIMQGLFESRQVEVSDEFGNFLDKRVLQSHSVLDGLVKSGDDGPFYEFLRRQLPFPIPTIILSAAIKAIQQTADEPDMYPELHSYISKKLDIAATLASRLKELPPQQFEDLLHPVFQEDEIILIATGGVLGAAAGLLQTRLGWGGPNAVRNAILTIIGTLAASAVFFLNNDGAEADTKNDKDEDVIDIILIPPMLLRRNTILRPREQTE
jgi:uncharacterized membrane protein YheB (UPF0754 family)